MFSGGWIILIQMQTRWGGGVLNAQLADNVIKISRRKGLENIWNGALFHIFFLDYNFFVFPSFQLSKSCKWIALPRPPNGSMSTALFTRPFNSTREPSLHDYNQTSFPNQLSFCPRNRSNEPGKSVKRNEKSGKQLDSRRRNSFPENRALVYIFSFWNQSFL